MNCPFYGRHMYLSPTKEGVMPPFILLDSQGNQCALVGDSFAPCRLEADGQPVEWSACPLMEGIRVSWKHEA